MTAIELALEAARKYNLYQDEIYTINPFCIIDEADEWSEWDRVFLENIN